MLIIEEVKVATISKNIIYVFLRKRGLSSWCRSSRVCVRLTGAAQALLVQAPDEVPAQVAPRRLSLAAGLEVVSLSLLLGDLGVVGTAQDPDDAHPAQQVWNLPRAYPQGVGPLQARWRAWQTCQVHLLWV